MPLPQRNPRTFEQSFVSSLYLRRTRTNNRALNSKLVKNFSKQELYRKVHLTKGNKPVSSFAAFPKIYKRRQGPLAKLIRTIDPLEYAHGAAFGETNIATTLHSPIKNNHFNLRATPGSPKSYRGGRRRPGAEGSLESPPIAHSTPISPLQMLPVRKTSVGPGGEVDEAGNNDKAASRKPESETMSKKTEADSWTITGQDPTAGWVKESGTASDLLVPFNLDAPPTLSRPGTTTNDAAALALQTASTVSIVNAVKGGRRTPFKMLVSKSATNITKNNNRQITYGTDQTLHSVSLLPCWPKRTTGTAFVTIEKDSNNLKASVIVHQKEIQEKMVENTAKNKKKRWKERLNERDKKRIDLKNQNIQYNNGFAEDKSHNMKTRLALMPRPLSRSGKHYQTTGSLTIVRSRPGSHRASTNDTWSNEILPWNNNDETQHLGNNVTAKDFIPAMTTQIIDQRPQTPKQQVTQRNNRGTASTMALKTSVSVATTNVRINISVLARLATVNMSFEVNSTLLTTSSKGWAEIEIADELLSAMRSTLDRDAKNFMDVSSSMHASFDWQTSQGHWIPLISGKDMKNAVHEKFHTLSVEKSHEKQERGLNLIIRLVPKGQTSLPNDGVEGEIVLSTPKSLSIHDGGVGRNLLQSRGKSSHGGSRGSSRQSVSLQSRGKSSRGSSRQSASRQSLSRSRV
jgi:hypothetical protein